MEIYGISGIEDKDLNFDYDKYYKELAIKLKNVKTEKDADIIRKEARIRLSESNNIKIDINTLKKEFIKLILDENSSKYLWILYSKYENNENYIDKISNILKEENSIIRGGTNTYKMNGWMAHTFYVYQIVNYNIANNIEILNFGENSETKKQVGELHELYKTLDKEDKFLLKIFCLIHDIGVIEDIKYHDKLGAKYVKKVLEEIGLTQDELRNNKISFELEDLIEVLKTIIKYHTLITTLSTEGNDEYVEFAYKDLILYIPNSINSIKYKIPKILFIMAYADIIGVDESLMDVGKYQRTKECYLFFDEVNYNKPHIRDKEKVAIERICDTAGKIKYETLKENLDDILAKYSIDRNQFIEDMFNMRLMRYTAPLMKNINDIELTIKIYNELFKLIKCLDGKDSLKEYTILFVPDNNEEIFTKKFKNGDFFKCIDKMKKTKENECICENIQITNGINQDGKFVHIKIVNN